MEAVGTVSIRTNSPGQSYHQDPEPAAKTHLVTALIHSFFKRSHETSPSTT